MNILRKLFAKVKNSGLVLLDQCFVSGTSFMIGVLLTRLLGLAEYGKFVLLWMAVMFGLGLMQAMITKPMLSLGPQMDSFQSKKYYAALHGVQIYLSLFATLICIIIMTLLSQFKLFAEINLVTVLGLSVAIGFILLYDFYRKYFFIKDELKTALKTDIFLAAIQLGGILVLYNFGLLDISNFLVLVSVSYLLVCCIGFLNILKPVFKYESIHQVFQKHYDFSKWLMGTVVLQWLTGNFFIICAGGILGPVAVGAVRISQNIIGLTHVIFLAMENVVPINAALAYKNGGEKKLYLFLKKISFQIGWIVMGVLIFVAVFAPQLLTILYGEEYVSYSYILIGFCVIYLLVYTSYPLRFALRTLELTKPIFLAFVIGATFSVLASTPMISSWGIYGVLAGIFITQLITQGVYIFSLWKIKKQYESHSLDTR